MRQHGTAYFSAMEPTTRTNTLLEHALAVEDPVLECASRGEFERIVEFEEYGMHFVNDEAAPTLDIADVVLDIPSNPVPRVRIGSERRIK
ncbi:MAG: hypothetical protein Q7S15_00285 [bacterium]|nr:hypothetical protein [bacterium]